MAFSLSFDQLSGHVGFAKAGHLLECEVRHVPLEPDTTPNIAKYKKAIDSNTVMVSGRGRK